jgi:hypothetical protein
MSRVRLVAREERPRTFAVLAAVLAAVTLLLAGSVRGQTTVETLGLTGPVSAMDIYREFPGTTDRQHMFRWTFDEAGLATERVYFTYSFMDGSLSGRWVTTYDAGLPLATVIYDADDQPTDQTVFRYDGEGRMTAQITVDAEGVETRRNEYERDADGNVVRETWTRDGALYATFERTYDASGEVIEERRFDEENRLVEVDTYTVPGREYESIRYDEDGEVESTGRGIESEDGTVLLEVLAPDGSVDESYAFAYDDKGRLTERRSTYGEGDVELLTYTYEEDDRGNWVRRVTMEDLGNGAEVYEIREREITYR